MKNYCSTILPDDLKRSETERSSLRYTPPIPFVPHDIENDDRKDHEIKVKLSNKLSETVTVFHGGIPEAYVMYLSDCAADPQKGTAQEIHWMEE